MTLRFLRFVFLLLAESVPGLVSPQELWQQFQTLWKRFEDLDIASFERTQRWKHFAGFRAEGPMIKDNPLHVKPPDRPDPHIKNGETTVEVPEPRRTSLMNNIGMNRTIRSHSMFVYRREAYKKLVPKVRAMWKEFASLPGFYFLPASLGECVSSQDECVPPLSQSMAEMDAKFNKLPATSSAVSSSTTLAVVKPYDTYGHQYLIRRRILDKLQLFAALGYDIFDESDPSRSASGDFDVYWLQERRGPWFVSNNGTREQIPRIVRRSVTLKGIHSFCDFFWYKPLQIRREISYHDCDATEVFGDPKLILRILRDQHRRDPPEDAALKRDKGSFAKAEILSALVANIESDKLFQDRMTTLGLWYWITHEEKTRSEAKGFESLLENLPEVNDLRCFTLVLFLGFQMAQRKQNIPMLERLVGFTQKYYYVIKGDCFWNLLLNKIKFDNLILLAGGRKGASNTMKPVKVDPSPRFGSAIEQIVKPRRASMLPQTDSESQALVVSAEMREAQRVAHDNDGWVDNARRYSDLVSAAISKIRAKTTDGSSASIDLELLNHGLIKQDHVPYFAELGPKLRKSLVSGEVPLLNGGTDLNAAVRDSKSEKSLKIYVYPEDSSVYAADYPSASTIGFWTSEVYFHRHFMHSPLRTMNPEEADYFFVPFYNTWRDIHFARPVKAAFTAFKAEVEQMEKSGFLIDCVYAIKTFLRRLGLRGADFENFYKAKIKKCNKETWIDPLGDQLKRIEKQIAGKNWNDSVSAKTIAALTVGGDTATEALQKKANMTSLEAAALRAAQREERDYRARVWPEEGVNLFPNRRVSEYDDHMTDAELLDAGHLIGCLHDFRANEIIKERIIRDHPYFNRTKGVDHIFVYSSSGMPEDYYRPNDWNWRENFVILSVEGRPVHGANNAYWDMLHDIYKNFRTYSPTGEPGPIEDDVVAVMKPGRTSLDALAAQSTRAAVGTASDKGVSRGIGATTVEQPKALDSAANSGARLPSGAGDAGVTSGAGFTSGDAKNVTFNPSLIENTMFHCPLNVCYSPHKPQHLAIPSVVDQNMMEGFLRNRKMPEKWVNRTSFSCWHGNKQRYGDNRIRPGDKVSNAYAAVNETLRNVIVEQLAYNPFLPNQNHHVGKTFQAQVYTKVAGDCKYCLSPKGLTSYTSRLYESFFAGCVPVILSDDLESPFDGEEIDWNSVTIRVPTGTYYSPASADSTANTGSTRVTPNDSDRFAAISPDTPMAERDALTNERKAKEKDAVQKMEAIIIEHRKQYGRKQTGSVSSDVSGKLARPVPNAGMLWKGYYLGGNAMKVRAESQHTELPVKRTPEEYLENSLENACWLDYIGGLGVPQSVCSPYRAVVNRLIKLKALGLNKPEAIVNLKG